MFLKKLFNEENKKKPNTLRDSTWIFIAWFLMSTPSDTANTTPEPDHLPEHPVTELQPQVRHTPEPTSE